MQLPSKIFVTGTDTGVGKSIISAMLVAGLNARYWKPIQSGSLDKTDSMVVQEYSNVSQDDILQEGYLLRQPLSPHASAALDNTVIDLETLGLPIEDGRPLVVEGAGGVMVPLNDDFLIIDLIKKLSLPVMLVARSGLGTINHTMLTIEALRRRDIDIVGVVMNGEKNSGNEQAIAQFGKVDVVAMDWLAQIGRVTLVDNFCKMFSLPNNNKPAY